MSVCELAENNFKTPSFINIHDFELLKYFKITIQSPCALKVVEVIWKLSLWDQVKINCDGAYLGNQSSSACGDIAKDFDGRFFGASSNFWGF